MNHQEMIDIELQRIQNIREAEAQSHIQTYSEHSLFAEGSWLSHPVKTVMDLLPYFDAYKSVRVLDLGCGVGRNSIPIAKHFCHIPCTVDCVDILPLAIKKLHENAKEHGVASSVKGYLNSIETYRIPVNAYDFVIAVSALEHICSVQAFLDKLQEIRDGLRICGIVCLIVSTDIEETDLLSGASLQPQFEVNLSVEELKKTIETVFSSYVTVKKTIVPQRYMIPRESKQVCLSSRVCTFVLKNERNHYETSN